MAAGRAYRRGEPSASACAELGHQWRAVDSPPDVTARGGEGEGGGRPRSRDAAPGGEGRGGEGGEAAPPSCGPLPPAEGLGALR